MLEITDITQQKKKNRYNLFVDGKFYSGIEFESLVKYSIKIGSEFEKKTLDNIILESESIVAFNKALKLITKNLKSESEIIKYLNDKGFIESVIQNVVLKLKEYNYINDEELCKNYISYNKEIYGKAKIRQNLKQKQISEEIIESFLDYDENDEKIRYYIEKYLKNKEKDVKTKQKLINHLLYKGYKFDDFMSFIREYFKD